MLNIFFSNYTRLFSKLFFNLMCHFKGPFMMPEALYQILQTSEQIIPFLYMGPWTAV